MSTLMSNLLLMSSAGAGEDMERWEGEYTGGAGMEIYRCNIGQAYSRKGFGAVASSCATCERNMFFGDM